MKFLRSHWPFLFLLVTELLLFITNYTPGTFLLGWDSIVPEFNFPLNFYRGFFGVWQDYRGLGYMDGMSNIANLPHTFLLWLLHFVLPLSLLRYTLIFSMHFLGIVGMYLLLRKILRNRQASLIGTLFYGFNLATIQMFYAPLEAFAFHFAALPWLSWSLLGYLFAEGSKGTKESKAAKVISPLAHVNLLQPLNTFKSPLIPFLLLSILFIPQGFVPQLFASYVLVIGSILFLFLWVKQYKPKTIIQSLVILLTIFCINAYWLLPYIYSIPHNAPIIMNSKINLMASEHIYNMNKARGDIGDVILLKGFMLDTAEFLRQGQFDFIMKFWRDYSGSPFFLIPAFFFFLLCVIGMSASISQRRKGFYPFLLVFLIAGFFLGNNIFGIDLLNTLLGSLLPAFHEAFRFPFTKFSILFAFCYSIFVGLGISYSTNLFSEYSKKPDHQKNPILRLSDILIHRLSDSPLTFPKIRTTYYLLLTTLLLAYSLPAFTGHFFFDALRLPLSNDYLKTIAYFNQQDPTARIATLPQPTFWNWEYHSDGYRGSGFVWYGIPQAMMERSFDPWSNTNEEYYWELSQALYSNNAVQLANVLEKYQITYVLVNKNIIYPSAPKSLRVDSIQSMLSQLGLTNVATFGNLAIYQKIGKPVSFVSSAATLPTLSQAPWATEDIFFAYYGSYIASSAAATSYPFGSLFSYRPEKDFSLSQTPDSIIVQSSIHNHQSSIVSLPSLSTENILPLQLVLENHTVVGIVTTPQIFLRNSKIAGEEKSYSLFTLPAKTIYPLRLTVNGITQYTISSARTHVLGTTFATLAQPTILTLQNRNGQTTETSLSNTRLLSDLSLPTSIPISADSSQEVTVVYPKITDGYLNFSATATDMEAQNCTTTSQGVITQKNVSNTIQVASVHGDGCLSFLDKNAFTGLSYALFITSAHIKGEPLQFWAENIQNGYSFASIQLPATKTLSTDALVLPPQDNSIGYSFHFDNQSTGFDTTSNQLQSLSAYPIPYNFLTGIYTSSKTAPAPSTVTPISFDHPNPSVYSVDFSAPSVNAGPHTLILSQSFDPGWKAFEMPNVKYPMSNIQYLLPFLFGTELKDHVLINNWENGWSLNNNELRTENKEQDSQSSGPEVHHPLGKIIIVFLPQYLEYLGFGILGVYLILFILNTKY